MKKLNVVELTKTCHEKLCIKWKRPLSALLIAS
jgi:hypothetical protein